ncbi:MAG: hypothetical protein SCK57_01890 [Bacillota bacterium]|nr:hypothetical protein [Bacillota bacterium]MDW7676396.1 hypothetical protein [Bacillota bacterium]
MNQVNRTKQILAHLSGQIGSLPEPAKSAKSSQNGPRLLIVFSGNPIGLDQVMMDLMECKKRGWIFDLAFSANAESLMDTDRIIRQLGAAQIIGRDMRDLKNYSMNHLTGVLAPLVTQNTARKLMMGIQDGLVPNLLWQALWDGIPVYMDLESLLTYHGRQTKNQHLARMMKQTMNTLLEMGVIMVKRPAEILVGNTDGIKQQSNQLKPSSAADGTAQKSVITEQDILAHANGQNTLNIPTGAIVTPLAKDTAAAHGIRLIRK